MDNLFNTLQLNEKIILKPGNFENIDLLVKNKLQKKIGNKCNKDGYVFANSIKILKRSIGKVNTSFFDGSISYNLEYSASVCNPKEGSIINVKYVDHKFPLINKCFYSVIILINIFCLFIGYPMVMLSYILMQLPKGILFTDK